MNVNSDADARPAGRKPRRRRTPEEARRLVLDTAERRLKEHGLDGLNIVGVAREAGISHATLLHHFGSSAGMRQALVERMTQRLIGEALATLSRDVKVTTLFRDLFEVFSTGGHARLLAWMNIEEVHRAPPSPEIRQGFAELIEAAARQLPDGDPASARNILVLVVGAAIGLGIAGDALIDLAGMDEDARAAFPDWLAESIGVGGRELRLGGQR